MCEGAQLAISVANPSAVMPVMVNQQPSANTVTATHIAELASAIAELRTDLHALRQSHLRWTDERVDQLLRRISSLQDEVTSSTQSPHQTCAAVDYDTAARHRQPGLDDHHCHRDCTAQHTQRGRQHPRTIAVLHDTAMAAPNMINHPQLMTASVKDIVATLIFL